eukprot:CAMPEP_0183314310 /NCGR_PEP_ID=MMETSP0160_2-20130417/48068_1 /TAXON_ID=2839 ORGANISM="Odontella Sinensis, Strain Grunow 1884" /NCGR_SAMPLE_ID=MMETSP0160_2 /ASSEMBLY_ACC=CAM_ASM_000250 /LENGTH=163 /DNA_ID=CAMNT_0025479609 /DNA_START=52 /DNA_END=543 /DNA_ORIENTATION=-
MTASTTTTTTTTQPEEEEESDKRWVVCGRGVGDDLTVCEEGEQKLVSVDTFHEVRCCKDGEPVSGWRLKCTDPDLDGVVGRSKIWREWGECHEENFYEAFDICEEAGGRLCTKYEVMNSCTKGTGCRHDRDMIWTCTGEGDYCENNSECCSGSCIGDACMEVM